MNRLCIVAIALLLAPAFANAERSVREWRVSGDGAYSEAFTASTSGATFGTFCLKSSAQCVYYFASEVECSDDATIPLLINVDNGAYHITGTCRVLSSKTRALVLSPYDHIETAISKGLDIGIAMPMVEGQFRVFRFSLSGSTAAIAEAQGAATRATGDQLL